MLQSSSNKRRERGTIANQSDKAKEGRRVLWGDCCD